ncbi:Uncharacterized protein dnm_092010 [Desulfonema magnum]|uniref:Uncharacterized protein n=1 Tax=Desulfonema magnum TaxID=45655 RepID=A0A975GTI4_9BACT|nr:Uncharacterized protein dnm_092010 [Desulfonema magnum]
MTGYLWVSSVSPGYTPFYQQKLPKTLHGKVHFYYVKHLLENYQILLPKF